MEINTNIKVTFTEHEKYLMKETANMIKEMKNSLNNISSEYRVYGRKDCALGFTEVEMNEDDINKCAEILYCLSRYADSLNVKFPGME